MADLSMDTLGESSLLAETTSRVESTRSIKDLILFAIVQGSGTGGVSAVKKTNLVHLPGLIKHPDGAHVIDLPIEGVGTNGSPVLDSCAAALGIGFYRRVIALYKLLVKNSREGIDGQQLCTIILAGHSRGAAVTIVVARLIDKVGLLIDEGDDEAYAKLYKLCQKGVWSKVNISNVKRDHKWRGNVKIDELLAFDCVDSLGVPVTGLGRALKLLPAWSKVKERTIVMPSCVQHITHVVMLQEPRAPYMNSTLCIREGSNQTLRQTYFNGRHGDSMGPGQIAFVLDIFKNDLNIEPNDAAVQKWFESRLTASEGKVIPNWISNPIKPVKSLALRLLGTERRIPGRYSRPGYITNEEIHSSVRHRGYGFDTLDPAVQGFFQSTDPVADRSNWASTGTNPGSNSTSSEALRIPEAPIRWYERSLSELPAN